MENTKYKAFLVSAEAGSFTKAAEILSYSPSGVHQLVNALEDEVGFPLLSRDKKGVKVTADGERILSVIRTILLEEERLTQVAAEIKGMSVGRIVIGSYPSISTHWLPQIIRDFQKEYPQIEIYLMEGIRQEIEEWLVSKRIDIALYSYKEPMAHEWITLDKNEMVATLPPDHPFARKKVYPLKNCQNEDFIMPALGRDEDVMEMLNRYHIAPHIQFSTLENYTTLAMIEQGLGMSIMNELCTRNWNSKVKKKPLDPPQFVTFGIAYLSAASLSPAVKHFIEYTVDALK